MLSSTIPVYDNSLPQVTMIAGLRVRQDLVSTNHKGEEKRRVRKRVEKSLEKLAEPLQKVMAPDEVIVYVVRCLAAVSPLEQLFLGWTAQYVLGVTLVFTNRRLLHFSSDRKGAWRRSSIRSLEWSHVGAARMKGWASPLLEVIHSHNKKQRYWSMPFWERKKLRQLLSILAPAENIGGGREWLSLCPECVKLLTPAVFQCANCGVVFKDIKTMRWRTILVPGGGYFYCGQTFLGVLHVLGDSFLLFEITFMAVTLAALVLGFKGSDPANLDATGIATILLIVTAIFVFEKTITFYHCRRFINEFIPTNRRSLGTTSKVMGVGSS